MTKIYLKDYTPLPYLITHIDLDVQIFDSHTIVQSTLKIKQSGASVSDSYPELVLNGQDLELLGVSYNGSMLSPQDYTVTDTHFIFTPSHAEFELSIETQIYPEKNLALEGLYKSGSIYCTQNEAEGFRKITYFYDRPDNLSIFTTKITADTTYPYLLSNGNLIEKGEAGAGRHYAVWEDPFPKPCYLFALVAGQFDVIDDHYITKSGRRVALQIFSDPGFKDQCYIAMDALKKSMTWDEASFNLEYDLDLYMIVAVDSFNMGAMENKGLNVFNSQYVLGTPETATDQDFLGIEGVIAHEYFHNWTGNRVTCRDWFQLTLKEGLTVFRDQEFSSDTFSRPIQRIQDVQQLRAVQFVEDSGPLAHPIRPESFVEIDNFYTSTIYEKGAEVIRMIHTIIGDAAFKRGIDLYFELFDGQAVTTDDFVATMEKASGKDLTLFKRWYSQAGTPEVTAHITYSDHWEITFTQQCRPTPETAQKQPFVLPIKIGVASPNDTVVMPHSDHEKCEARGNELIFILDKTQDTVHLSGIGKEDKPTLLNDFSAPVTLKTNYTQEDWVFMLKHDPNSFTRFEAKETVFIQSFLSQYNNETTQLTPLVLEAFETCLSYSDDLAYKGLLLTLPSLTTLLDKLDVYDIHKAHTIKQGIKTQLATTFESTLRTLYNELATIPATFEVDAIKQRSLKSVLLSYLSENKSNFDLIRTQYTQSRSMSEIISSLSCAVSANYDLAKPLLDDFIGKWSANPLLVNKWLALQVSSFSTPTLPIVKALETHPLFEMTNPNKMRALLGSFARNLVQFHHPESYAYYIDKVIEIDRFNASIASRLVQAFKQIRKYPTPLQTAAKTELIRLSSSANASKQILEVTEKLLS